MPKYKDGIYAGNDEEDYKYLGIPSSNIAKLEPGFQAILDLAVAFVLGPLTIIRLILKKATKTAKIRALVIVTLLLLISTMSLLTLF